MVERIASLTEVERVGIIQKISESYPIDDDLAALLPWKPRKIKLSEQRENYISLTNEKLELDRYKRELSRIRGSPLYRLTALFSDSLRSPWKIIQLPVNSILLSIRLARERLGHIEKQDIEKYPIGSRIGENRDSIVLFPTNGVGFGHFTRLLAVAKKIQKIIQT